MSEPLATAGPYRCLELLGRGGMGLVYRARHQETGQLVALKTLRLPRRQQLAGLRREILGLGRLRHPGVVRMLEHGLEQGLPWYAMELVEGRSLERFRQDLPEPPPAGGAAGPIGEALLRILTLVRSLCSPLAYLHGQGLVHRDLKPENILIRPDGTPVLVDFGLLGHWPLAGLGPAAGHGQEPAEPLSRERLEIDAGFAGTAQYMAPEQIRGELVDARADLYALGCLLHELLTGRPPFVRLTVGETLEAHLSEPAPPPSVLAAGLPAELDELVLKLLDKAPHRRPGHAAAVGAALARLGAVDRFAGSGPAPRSYLYRPGFAGREVQLEALEGHRRRVLQGQGALVFIGGESGVGKTRLVLELGRRAARDRALVLGGECPEAAGGPLEALRRPLRAVVELCREQGPEETRRVLGGRAGPLRPYEPALAGLQGLEDEPAWEDLPAEATRRLLLGALAGAFGSLAGRRPLVLILDDLQWADELTLGFVEHLLRDGALERGALLLVGTYRTEECGERLRGLVDLAGSTSLKLGRLEPAEAEVAVAGMLGLERPPADLARALVRHSEGLTTAG